MRVSHYLPWIQESLKEFEEFDHQKIYLEKLKAHNRKKEWLSVIMYLGLDILGIFYFRMWYLSTRGCKHYWFICMLICSHKRRLSIFWEFFQSRGAYYLVKCKATKAMPTLNRNKRLF